MTAQYMDVETRLENLKNQRTRLQQLQQQADNLSDLLEIESSLTDAEPDRELAEPDELVQQSGGRVHRVREPERGEHLLAAQRGLRQPLCQRPSAGWQNFVDGLQQVIVALAGAWPVVVIAAAACAGFVVWKRRKINQKYLTSARPCGIILEQSARTAESTK